MSTMKVAYLLGSLNRGGAETLILDVFHNSDKAPFEMIGIHRKGGAYMDDFYKAGPKMIQCALKRYSFFRYLWHLHQILIKEKISIIHAQYWLDAIYARLASIGLDVSIVLTFHGYKGYETKHLKSLQYKIAMYAADKLCFVSQYQKKQYASRYGDIVEHRGCVLYNGIDFEKFEYNTKIPCSVLPENHKGSIKLCMVGSFNSVRNQKIIVEALNSLVNEEKIIPMEFYFIGGKYIGEEYRYDECLLYCQEHHLDNVHFLGSRGDVPALLHQMDGYVYSTLNDTFGIAVVEALVARLPIVVNDHPVMKEVCAINTIDSNCAIRFFRTGEIGDCAEKIQELLSNIETNKKQLQADCQLSVNAIKHKYNIDTHIQQLYLIYQSL